MPNAAQDAVGVLCCKCTQQDHVHVAHVQGLPRLGSCPRTANAFSADLIPDDQPSSHTGAWVILPQVQDLLVHFVIFTRILSAHFSNPRRSIWMAACVGGASTTSVAVLHHLNQQSKLLKVVCYFKMQKLPYLDFGL